MGKTKSKSIRKAAKKFTKEGINFSGNFEKNKKVLGNLMPSKKLRNQMAGLLAKTKKQELMQLNVK